MASSKKDLCPVCRTNMKGVDSKQCAPCRRKEMKAPPSEPPCSKPHVGDTTPDGKFYL